MCANACTLCYRFELQEMEVYFYLSGIADVTLFTLTCADWIEWNVTSQNLKYEYRVASYGIDRYVRVPNSKVRTRCINASTCKANVKSVA